MSGMYKKIGDKEYPRPIIRIIVECDDRCVRYEIPTESDVEEMFGLWKSIMLFLGYGMNGFYLVEKEVINNEPSC